MTIEQTAVRVASLPLRSWQVYSMAGICLVAGLAAGYVLRATQAPASRAGLALVPAAPAPVQRMGAGTNAPSLDQLKQSANRQAAPLLVKLKDNPNDTALLLQLGAIYHTSHRFREAAYYYGKAVQLDPKNAEFRTKLAISLYRDGDIDGAIAQLNRALHDNPNDANALFNLGLIRWQGKQDGAGAVAVWQQLLQLNPQLGPDRKAEVQKLMADVLSTTGDQSRDQGAQKNGRP